MTFSPSRIAVTALALALLAPRAARAQHPPPEATRAGPHPRAVAHGEALAFARTFAASRQGARLLVVYVENDGAAGALRSALFTITPGPTADAPPTLVRTRDDATLAPNARAVSLAWGGRGGAVVYVAPRVAPQRDPAHAWRTPSVGLPPSTRDPLGPPSASGGDVVFQRVDAEGVAAGDGRVVFTENARLRRVSVARERDTWALAWTGATVTDDEVRGTVRALRLADDGAPSRPMASATNFSGDAGDALRLSVVGGRTVLAFTGSRCLTRENAPAPPVSLNTDPSSQIETPARSPQPQAPPREVPGPPIECGPTSLHFAELRADGTLSSTATGPWLRADAVAIADGVALAPVANAAGDTVLARVPFAAGGALAPTDAATNAAFALAPLPAFPPQPVENRTRPPPDWEPLVRETPVEPPPLPTNESLRAFLRTPRAVAGAAGGPLLAVTADRRALALVRGGAATLLATTASMFYDAAVLPDGASAVALAREGTWSGPLRFFALPASGAVEALALPEASPVAAPARPARYATREPLRYDAEFSRLFAHVRTLRAIFMRHENVAGALAARPEAPTDPRMPGVIAVRNRLRSRWESACSQLRARATTLARAGAGMDVLQGVGQVCEIHADLQLGVPVNPAL